MKSILNPDFMIRDGPLHSFKFLVQVCALSFDILKTICTVKILEHQQELQLSHFSD